MHWIHLFFMLAAVFNAGKSDKDDKKWVWSANNRNSNARSFDNGLIGLNPNSRYNVFESTDEILPSPTSFIPNNNHNLLLSQRPSGITNNGYRPPLNGALFSPSQRPGGVYATNSYRPTYGATNNYPSTDGGLPPTLTGPVPSWIKEGPIKNFDKCKCAEKFNCNSPGISYGHCDVGKQYCCYSTKKDYGGSIASKPIHSIENGILVGPGGPIDPIPLGSRFPRPPKQIGGLGLFGQNGVHEHHYEGQNEYSPANGILVGPGGPFDAPAFGLGRSAKSTKE